MSTFKDILGSVLAQKGQKDRARGKTPGNTKIFIRKYQEIPNNFRKYLEISGNTCKFQEIL
jgi:hypothetical protein